MFITVCELAFIPNKSLRACSLDEAWIRVFRAPVYVATIPAAKADG